MDSGRWIGYGVVLATVLGWQSMPPGLIGASGSALAQADEAQPAAKPGEPPAAVPEGRAKANPFAVDQDQDQAEDQDQADKFKAPDVFVPADRTVLRLLDRAQLLLQQDRYAEAVRCLGAILDSPEDYFFKPDKSAPVHRSLKAEAQRLLGEMPKTGRELYELQYGARARQMLDEAVAAGDASKLSEVSRRFYHTRAGYEASLLLGLNHMDHGRWLAGALVLQRLRDTAPVADQFEPTLSLAIATCWLRAGSEDRAQEALVELKTRRPEIKVAVGGKEVPLFDRPSEALAWLTKRIGPTPETDVIKTDNWAMFRGNAARNAASLASGPLLSLRWRVPTTDHPYLEALIGQLQEADHQRDEWAVPGLHPLVVDDVVLMRTVHTLLAVDFKTGKRIWEVPVDDPFEPLLNPPPDSPYQRGPQLEQALRYRLWGDATYGTLSSDGHRVFAIEDLPLETGSYFMHGMFFRRQRQEEERGPRPYNRLAAFDIHTGKLQWHVGGSPEEFGLPLAGTFFLGPPLPLMDQLFAIAEVKGEIRLLALEAKTGKLLWSQQLADVDRAILDDPLRRLAGVSPSYSDGILVCPTSNKSIVALELASRSLLWGYSFATEADANDQAMFFAMHGMIDPNPGGRWSDSSVLIADGRVLATPIESGEIHCLNLVDGKLLWKQAREDDLYLACVHEGNVVLVGKQRVRALKLEDGLPAWEGRTVDLPSGSRPSGTGFLSGDLYHVPLSSAEVMAVDVRKGRVENLFKSRRESVPGNLVCYDGMVISQRADGLEVFYQLEALKNLVDQRLAGSPDDPEALRLQGEILWHQNKLDAAIAAFHRSLALKSDPGTRDLLREAYFDGLESDFAGHRQDVTQLEPLIETACQRARFLRLMALGLERTGDFQAALEHYMKLIELDHDNRNLETVDKAWSIRRDRWVRVRLAALRETGSDPTRQAIDQFAAARLKAAQQQATPESLQRFLDYFGSHPLADEARRELIAKLRAAGRLLEAELLLLQQQRSADRAVAAGAVAELAELLRAAGRHREAAFCYARLQGELADVPCADGKTGKDLVAALPADDPVRRQLRTPTWPTSRIDVARSHPRLSAATHYLPSALEFSGPRGPFFQDVSLELHHNPPTLLARGGLGETLWRMGMSEMVGQDRFLFNRSMTRVSVQGHLMLVSVGNKLLALDTLVASEGNPPRILWQKDLQGSDGDLLSGPQRVRVLVANVAGRVQRVHFSGNDEMPISVPEAINEELVCLRQFHRCVALNPVTGEVLWQRNDIRPDSTLFGDHQYVFVVPAGETKARVLRALDGEVLGQREIPMERLATFGRRMLLWRDKGDYGALEMVDAWSGKPVWPAKRFPASAQVSLVGDEAVALFEPMGRFLLVNLADGRAVIDTKLEPEHPMCEMLAFRSPGQYLVITQGPEEARDNHRHTHQIPGTTSHRITKARLYAFDEQGQRMWDNPVKVEDQFLLLDQPSHLPVFVFAAMVQQRKPPQQVTATNTVVLGIDKRNGRVICSEAIPNGSNGLSLVGDPEQRTVEIRLQRETITLTFSDEAAKPTEALWKAFRKVIF